MINSSCSAIRKTRRSKPSDRGSRLQAYSPILIKKTVYSRRNQINLCAEENEEGIFSMMIAIESIILCFLFFIMVFVMSRDPIKTLYNYPPAIQERVRSLDEYKDKIPTKKNKLAAKITALILFVIVISLILRFVNGYTDFLRTFGCGFLIWTVVNLFDLIVLDMI